MTRRKFLLTSVCGFAIAALAASFAGQRSALAIGPDEEQAELANAMSGVKVSLQQGLTASEREGQPISGKFEVENGKIQLSVYTAKDGKFSEVIVDHMTGHTLVPIRDDLVSKLIGIEEHIAKRRRRPLGRNEDATTGRREDLPKRVENDLPGIATAIFAGRLSVAPGSDGIP